MAFQTTITRNTRHPRDDRDWRCSKCLKLLGRRGQGGIQVQFARGHRYIVSGTVTAVCRCCGRLNEACA